MVADSPPTHVMRRQLPWKLEFATLIKCVGGVLSPGSSGCHLSWSKTDRLKPISHPHTSNPRLQAAPNFLLDFRPLRFFSKMFLTTEIAQILPGGLIRPTLQSEKKTFGGQKKKTHSLFSGPFSIIIINNSASSYKLILLWHVFSKLEWKLWSNTFYIQNRR